MNVWYINSILGAICLEEENDALCGVHFCPDGAPAVSYTHLTLPTIA